jgi:glycosyltransferase involved in cell wall biosynthesis
VIAVDDGSTDATPEILERHARADLRPSEAAFCAVYQPVSHFWPLQLTETALFVGVAFLLIAFAAWRVLASD